MADPTFTPQAYGIELKLPEDPAERARLIEFFDTMAAERAAQIEREFQSAIACFGWARERKVRCSSTSL
jgi:hypothetical protein